MVVLAASVTTAQGKVLVSRQFVDITQARIESLLSAFPKLREGSGDTTKQHTLIETNSVRYLYQKIEDLFLLVITSKSSNIVEDLATLQVLSRVVPEYCGSHVSEKTVIRNGFELIFAFDEVVALGYRENISKIDQIRSFTSMVSQEEIAYERQQKNQEREAKEILKRRMKEIEKERRDRERMGLPAYSGSGSRPQGYGYSSDLPHTTEITTSTIVSSSPRTSYSHTKEPEKKVRKGLLLGKKETNSNIMDQLKKEGEITNESVVEKVTPQEQSIPEEPLIVEIQEQMKCIFDRDGTNPNIDVSGFLSVNAMEEEATQVQLHIKTSSSEIPYRVHPNIDQELFSEKNILGLKDRTKAYPLRTPINVLRWRYQSNKENDVPLIVSCWPTTGVNGSLTITLEYELNRKIPYELKDISISFPLVCKDTPSAFTDIGKHQYNTNSHQFNWNIPFISAVNDTKGSIEINAQRWDNNSKWVEPVTITYTSKVTFCQLFIQSVLAPSGESIPFSLLQSLEVTATEVPTSNL